MSSVSEKLREKLLIESIVNKDKDSFLLLFAETVESQYASRISSRFNELEGIE